MRGGRSFQALARGLGRPELEAKRELREVGMETLIWWGEGRWEP